MKTEFDYASINPGYYHEAMLRGKQKYWHRWKFGLAAERVPNKNVTVLDVGCGPGSFFYVLRKKNKHAKLIGTDLVKKQLEYARTVVPDASWFVADAVHLPVMDNSVDVAVSLEVIEHLPPAVEHKILVQIKKSLRKDGRLVISTPNYGSLWPVIEWVWNKVSPVSYEHQHVNKKTIRSLIKGLRKAGFQVSHASTFFIISPFVAAVWPVLGRLLLKLERALFPKLGMIILVEAKKP